MIHQDFQGFHPGYRDVHASGRYYAGVFRATPEAKALSRAVHLQGDSVPVTVRYSNSGSGNPWGPATTASMSARFYLPDGTVTDLVSLPFPLFFARTPEETLEFLEAVRPDPGTGKPDPYRIEPFLAARPWVAHAVQLAKNLPASISLAQTAFHMLHAFRFVNDAGEVQYARYHWEPDAGVAGQTLDELQKLPPSYLFEELEARLRKAPVIFNLVLQLAGSGDPKNDPNAPWPEDRPRVRIGQLQIVRTTTVEEIGDPVMMHDPTRLTDGIEPSNDPVLAVRRGVYEVSVAYRTGGWKGRLAALERAGCPFGGNAVK
nr:catalase family peroxidase [Dyella humicola]